MRKKNTKGRKAKKASPSFPATAAIAPASTAETSSAAPAAITSPAPRSTRKRASKKRSVRYTSELQAEIVQFVHDYNAKNGRAGQASASKKYGVSVLTISKWLKSSGKPAKTKVPGRRGRPRAASPSASASTGIEGTLKRMLEIQTKIDGLRAEF